MEKIKTLVEYEQVIAESKEKLVVIKFGADWCGPCKAIEKTIENIIEERDDVHFYSIDVDDIDSMLTDKYHVQSIPHLVFIKNGITVDTSKGNKSKRDLNELIDNNKNA